uniref:ABC transmembrane type-1 domain-containing protein n=1 Tax=Ditylenchus dipsaci TaxID=166011 RepID=A0A915DH41_9BILA
MQTAVAGANQVATERLTNIRTVRVLVAEQKEMRAYRSKITEIWNISKKEGFAKGCCSEDFSLQAICLFRLFCSMVVV